jgi:hypothetical protein
MSCDRRRDKVPSVQSLKDSLPTVVVPRIGRGPSAILEKWGEFLIQVTQTNRGERGVCAAYRALLEGGRIFAQFANPVAKLTSGGRVGRRVGLWWGLWGRG